MKTWVVIGGVVLVAAMGLGAYSTWSSGVTVQAARVEQGNIREFVDEQGKTRLPETHLITMPFAGRIQEIQWLEGQKVQSGDVIAQVVPSDLDNDVAEAQAAVDRLVASIAENDDSTVERSAREQALQFVESMVSTVAAADARKIAGRSRVDFAETFLGRIRRLVDSGGTTKDELDRAELEYVESQVNYQQDVLIAEAVKSIKAATELLPRMVSEYITRKDLTREVLEKQKSEAEARLRQALLNKQRGTMTSPVDGVVLERPIHNEQYLSAGTVLVEIGQLARMEVEADILSEDVVRIQPGDVVEIYGPAVGAAAGSGVAGTVHRIYPAGFTKISSLGVEQQRVMVIVRFADGELEKLHAARDVGVDYRVRVRIFTDEKTDALLVPRSALFRSADGGWNVFAVVSSRAELRPVTVGLMNDERAEITAGLTEGDTVVLAPESSLSDGDRVRPVLRRG